MTVEEIRATFQEPMTSDAYESSERAICYCVLGAAEMALSFENAVMFPSYIHARQCLGITEHDALNIIEANDAGDFERAWELLDKALKEKDNANRP